MTPILLCERFLKSLIPALSQPEAAKAQQAVDLFQRLEDEDAIGLVTPTIYGELLHVAIKLFYQQLAMSQKPKPSWMSLYKSNPWFLQTLQSDLEQLRTILINSRLMFVAPEELGKIDAGTTYDIRLIELCCAYALDTSDAGILLEAERLGIDSIVTMDSDLLRARADFDIYTWI